MAWEQELKVLETEGQIEIIQTTDCICNWINADISQHTWMDGERENNPDPEKNPSKTDHPQQLKNNYGFTYNFEIPDCTDIRKNLLLVCTTRTIPEKKNATGEQVEKWPTGVAPSPTPRCSSYRKGSLQLTLN